MRLIKNSRLKTRPFSYHNFSLYGASNNGYYGYNNLVIVQVHCSITYVFSFFFSPALHFRLVCKQLETVKFVVKIRENTLVDFTARINKTENILSTSGFLSLQVAKQDKGYRECCNKVEVLLGCPQIPTVTACERQQLDRRVRLP